MQNDELETHVDRLHAETVVVNTYGGPYTSANVLRKFRVGYWHHGNERFVGGNPPFSANVLAPEMKEGGVDVILGGYASLADHAQWLADVEESDGAVRFVSSVEEMKTAKADGAVGIQVILHGPATLDGNLDLLAVHRQLGATVFTLCSSYRNAIVDGCREPDNGGLSVYGRQVIAALNRHRIAIDMSHISAQGFWDVLERTTAPPIFTHTAAKAVCDSPRNMTDEQFKAHAGAGGFIGVIFFPAYLNPVDPTVEDLLDHIDHIANLVGPQYIGLGADFCQYGWDWTSLVWARSGMPERRYQFPTGIEDVTKWKNVTRGLVRRGYSDDEIKGILGGNYLRIIEGIIGDG